MSGSALVVRGNALHLPLPDASVQCIVTSPPYNVGVDYDGYSDVRPWDDYWADTDRWAAEIYRVAAASCRAWINVVPSVPTVPLPAGDHSGRCSATRESLLGGWMSRLLAAGFQMQDVVAWPSARGPGTAWGSWRSPAGPNLRGEWEAIIAVYKGTWSRSTPAAFKGWQDDGEWTRLTSNVWKVQPQHRSVNGHPAPFPVELAARAIRLSTWPGEVVLDPFSGSGATVRAAKDLGRLGVGVDQSFEYCRQATEKAGQEVLAL